MTTVTGFTAARMLTIEDETVVDGNVVGDDLVLVRRDGATINAGSVRGPQGVQGVKGDTGDVTTSQLNAAVAASEAASATYTDDEISSVTTALQAYADNAASTTALAMVGLSNYTPVVTNMSLGSSPFLSFSHTWVGEPQDNGPGIFYIKGRITFDTGASWGSAGTISFPTIYSVDSTILSSHNLPGEASIYDASSGDTYKLIMKYSGSSSNGISFQYLNTSGSSAKIASISSSLPITPANNDVLYLTCVVPARRAV